MNTQHHDPWVDLEFEQQVRVAAYFLWEQDGRPHGKDKEHWFIALGRCLREREAEQLIGTSSKRDFLHSWDLQ